MEPTPADIRSLVEDKYGGDESADITDDLARIKSGEPLAYVIGWIPFLGLHIDLATRPLIPRPETEYWTEQLISHLHERFGDTSFSLLDLCAGSGAIGLSVLKALPGARVSFGEIEPSHANLIRENIALNGLDASRADVCVSDLFEGFLHETFDVIATNPPYVPSARVLDASVTDHEPAIALFAGENGLAAIREIGKQAKTYLKRGGEVWLECDQEHADQVPSLMHGARTSAVHPDQYGRARYVVSYYP